MMHPSRFDSLFEPVARRAVEAPDAMSMILVHEDGGEEIISAMQLHEAALAAGAVLRENGIGQGDIVIVLLHHSRELVDLLWGLISIGAVPAIFPYLTEKLDPEIYRRQTTRLIASSGASALATSSRFERDAARLAADAGCRVITVDGIGRANGSTSGTEPTPSAGEAPAFIQYSSGTTGIQKGVIHSHRDLLGNLCGVVKATDARADDVVVTWLPLFHDFGIICGFLLPATLGIPAVLMSPFYWLRNPKSLFEKIHSHRGSMTFMPNFAFNHCVRSIRERDTEGLDLSSWRVLFNGSEPARIDSIRSFVDRFGACGLSESAIMVGYGTTECGGISMTRADCPPPTDWVDLDILQTEKQAVPAEEGSQGAIPIMSCGFSLETVEIAIVDADGDILNDRLVGEIVTRGPYGFKKYHNEPERTARATKSGWFQTGDLGYLANGQLYICGRIKDVINTGGRNIHPEDLEEIANKVQGIYPGRSVAFGVLDDRTGTEGVVMVCELRGKSARDESIEIERRLRRTLVAEMEVTLADVHLIEEKGWVIKTSNGKIARTANRAKYLKTLARGPFSEPLAVTSSGGSDCGLKIAD